MRFDPLRKCILNTTDKVSVKVHLQDQHRCKQQTAALHYIQHTYIHTLYNCLYLRVEWLQSILPLSGISSNSTINFLFGQRLTVSGKAYQWGREILSLTKSKVINMPLHTNQLIINKKRRSEQFVQRQMSMNWQNALNETRYNFLLS